MCLQAKKLLNLKKAFNMFEAINVTPGKAEISQYELRVRQKCNHLRRP